MAEGKVGSLFVEFRTNLNQFIADMQKMVSEVRSFDATVSKAAKTFSDLGHLGNYGIEKLSNDLQGLTSGINQINTFSESVRRASVGLSDLGHLGSAAISGINNDLQGLTSGINQINTFSESVRKASVGLSDLGHLGSTAIREINNDLQGLGSGGGISTFNESVRRASVGLSDLGHLGTAAISGINNDLQGLGGGGGVSTFNESVRKASVGLSDLGHLGSAAISGINNDLQGLSSGGGVSTFDESVRKASVGLSDLGHLGSTAVREANNDLQGLTSVFSRSTFNEDVRKASVGLSDLGHLGSTAMNGAAVATATFGDRIRQASTELRQFDRVFAPIKQRLNEIGFALSIGVTAPLLAMGAYSLKVGKDFETAFAGVRQTLNASEPELAKLREDLIDLSTTAPTSAAEFANIATTVAKLGVEAPEDIKRFASTINELTAVTNLSGDAAANFLGRFTNITHLPQDQIHNLASTLFVLGKAFPAVESELTNFSLRVAKTGSFVGLTSGQILAFSTAMASVGIVAESGGTAISRVLAEMAKASENLDSTRLKQFASVARVSTKQFSDSFKKEGGAAGAVLDFVRGLQRIKDSGGDVFTTLDAMKLGNVRTRETLLGLARGSGDLSQALELQAKEMEKNGELTRAYGEKTKTTDSQLKIFKNNVDALGISLFDAIGPVINNTILPALKRLIDEGLKPALKAFEDLPLGAQHIIEGMLVLAAATGPAILGLTKLVSFVEGLIIISDKLKLSDLGLSMAKLGDVASKVVGPLTLVGIAIAGWELENVIIDSLGLQKQFDAVKSSADELAKAAINLAGAFGRVAIKELIGDLKNFKTVADTLVGPLKSIAIAIILPRLVQTGAEFQALTVFLNDLSKAMDGTATSANSLPAAMARVMAATTNSLPAAMARVMASFKEGDHVPPPGPSPEELAAQGEAAAKLAKEHEKLIDTFVDEFQPATKLNEELSYLLKYFSEDEVVAVYAKKIVDAAEGQWAHNRAISGSIGVLYEQAKAIQTADERLKEMLKDASKDVPTIHMQIPGITGGVLVPTPTTSPLEIKALEQFNQFSGAREEINKLDLAIKNLSFLGPDVELKLFSKDLKDAEENAKSLHVQLPPNIQDLLDYEKATKDAADGLKAWQDIANSGKKIFDEMTTQVSATSAALHDILDDPAGFATAQIFDIMGAAIDKLAENARILKINLDPVIADLVKMREEMKKDVKETSDLGKEMQKVTTEVAAKIVNDLSQGIADALLGSKGLGDLGKKLGHDFAAAFIKAAVEHVVATLVKKLTDAAATHPIVAAVVVTVAVVAAVVRALSDSHLFANQFVKETQNPFGKSLSQFLDTSNKLYAAGRQTYQGAQEAETKVRDLWQGFLDDAAKFGEQGRKQATVAQQAIETLSPTFRRVIFDIQKQIESLKPPSVRAVESVNALAAYRAQLAANTDEHIAELRMEAAAIDAQIHYVMDQIRIQEELGGSTTELNEQLKELVYQWDAIRDQLDPLLPKLYTFAEAVKSVSENLVPDKTLSFLDQVLNATSGSANLEEALGVLESIGTPVAIIIDRLGTDIENFAHALELSGLPIPPLIQKYLKLKDASDNASKEMPRIANSLSKLVGDAVEKLRNIAGGGNLAQSILDALERLLTGLPSPSKTSTGITATMDVGVREAVDKVRGVAESILSALKNAAPAVAAADIRQPAQDIHNNIQLPIDLKLPMLTMDIEVRDAVNRTRDVAKNILEKLNDLALNTHIQNTELPIDLSGLSGVHSVSFYPGGVNSPEGRLRSGRNPITGADSAVVTDAIGNVRVVAEDMLAAIEKMKPATFISNNGAVTSAVDNLRAVAEEILAAVQNVKPAILTADNGVVTDAIDNLRAIAEQMLAALPITFTADNGAVVDAIGNVRAVAEEILVAVKSMEPVATVNVNVNELQAVMSEILVALRNMEPSAADTRTTLRSISNNAPTPTFVGAQSLTPVTQQISITIQDNEVITNEFTFTAEINRQTVRDIIMPEITEALTNNSDSNREKWIRIIRGAGMGVSAK